jgi:hypothetical protein
MQLSAIFMTLFANAAFTPPGCSKRDEVSALLARVINNGRPVATGACCIADTSMKGDACKPSDGTAGICASANTTGCKSTQTRYFAEKFPVGHYDISIT